MRETPQSAHATARVLRFRLSVFGIAPDAQRMKRDQTGVLAFARRKQARQDRPEGAEDCGASAASETETGGEDVGRLARL